MKCNKCKKNKPVKLAYNTFYCEECLRIIRKQADKELGKALNKFLK